MSEVKCANCGTGGKTAFHNFKFRFKKRNHQAWLCKLCRNMGMHVVIDIDKILRFNRKLKEEVKNVGKK